jgi:UDP-2,4-diacetamido-2,4,6-trideoxy-beta-L-altropyranose hydrolase
LAAAAARGRLRVVMSRSPRILFLADAGPAVGGGHVMRCLTLAQALRRAGAECAFAATPAVAGVLDVFAGAGIARLRLAEAEPALLVAGAAEAAVSWRADVVVVDHYRVDAAMEQALGKGRHLMAMDDLRRRHACDLLLDSNLDRAASDYPGLEALIGPDFALVRPLFVARREAALARRSEALAPRRLLVSLGLTDVGGITGRVMAALGDDLGDLEVDVVLGAAAVSVAAIEALAARDERIRLHVDSQQMAELTAAADLAIGAGGSSTWERCCLGLPTITVVLADNQRANAEALAGQGASLVLDAGDTPLPLPTGEVFQSRLRETFLRMAEDEGLRTDMTRAAAALCDGQGAERVAARLLALLG